MRNNKVYKLLPRSYSVLIKIANKVRVVGSTTAWTEPWRH